MYKKIRLDGDFYLKILSPEKQKEYKEMGEEILRETKIKTKKALDDYLLPDKSINVENLEQDWFPQIKADIFLSHSHKDKEKALILAGILKKEFKLTVFIDSSVWGYANDLLREIDKKYSLNSSGSYDYDKSTWSAANVHLTLMMALKKMIDKTECLMFLNTPNSIKISESGSKDYTGSPWIYSEIEITNSLKITEPKRYSESTIKASMESATYTYKVDFKDFLKLTEDKFKSWYSIRNNVVTNHLDTLYRILESK